MVSHAYTLIVIRSHEWSNQLNTMQYWRQLLLSYYSVNGFKLHCHQIWSSNIQEWRVTFIPPLFLCCRECCTDHITGVSCGASLGAHGIVIVGETEPVTFFCYNTIHSEIQHREPSEMSSIKKIYILFSVFITVLNTYINNNAWSLKKCDTVIVMTLLIFHSFHSILRNS